MTPNSKAGKTYLGSSPSLLSPCWLCRVEQASTGEPYFTAPWPARTTIEQCSVIQGAGVVQRFSRLGPGVIMQTVILLCVVRATKKFAEKFTAPRYVGPGQGVVQVLYSLGQGCPNNAIFL